MRAFIAALAAFAIAMTFAAAPATAHDAVDDWFAATHGADAVIYTTDPVIFSTTDPTPIAVEGIPSDTLADQFDLYGDNVLAEDENGVPRMVVLYVNCDTVGDAGHLYKGCSDVRPDRGEG